MNRCSQEIHLLILRIFAAIIPQLKQWVFSPQEIIIEIKNALGVLCETPSA